MKTRNFSPSLFEHRPAIVFVPSLNAYVDEDRAVAADADIVSEDLRDCIRRGDVAESDEGVRAFSQAFEFDADAYDEHFRVERDPVTRQWVRVDES